MQGVIYLSTGSRLDLVRNSLGSLRKTNPGLKAHVVCDRPFDGSFTWVQSKRGFSSRYYKTSLNKYSLFELTLYVDRDTFFLKPLPPLDELLEGCDIGLTLEPGAHSIGEAEQKLLKYYRREVRATLAEYGRQAPYYNSGVMIWRDSPKVHRFFECWKNEWLRFRRIDQLALTRAIMKSEISVRALPRPYNYVTRFTTDIESIPGGWPAATIVHFTHLQKRKAAQDAGIWDPLPAGPYESAFANSRTFGN